MKRVLLFLIRLYQKYLSPGFRAGAGSRRPVRSMRWRRSRNTAR
ncbi:MAG: hypothetical protein ACLU3I_04855 [Acutalibacteraceae bacterium]